MYNNCRTTSVGNCHMSADNFGGRSETFCWFFFNFMFMIWDSRHEDLQLFWLSFKHWELQGPWFNIKMSSYQYRNSHCGDKTILRPSYLHNGISYTDKMTSLYWIRAQGSICFSRYGDSHYKDKVVVRPSYLYNEYPYAVKRTFLYWKFPQGKGVQHDFSQSVVVYFVP